MKRIAFGIFLLVGFFTAFFLPPKTYGASMNLQSGQSSLGVSDEYSVNVTLTISSANGTAYYLRGAFYQTGTSNYCGYTYNGSSYYNGPYTTNNGWTNLLQVSIQNSSWSGTLKAKLDPSDAGCNSSGTYNFKIERFTLSGTGTFDSQNEQTLTVTIPTSTPTPAPTNTPIPATNTTMPTTTPKPTATPTPKSSSTSTKLPTISLVSPPPGVFATISGVLGISTTSVPTRVAGMQTQGVSPFIVLCLVVGVLLLSACGILVYQYIQKRKVYAEDSHE